ncbi:MAG: hypothetical protein ACOX9E_06370, partial [Lentisphaeria bacterium]
MPLRVKPRRRIVFLVSREGFLSADVADCRRLWRHVLPLRVKPRRRGVFLVSCEGFFIRRCRGLSQIMASWLAAARQATPPGCVFSFTRRFFYPQMSRIVADYGVM